MYGTRPSQAFVVFLLSMTSFVLRFHIARSARSSNLCNNPATCPTKKAAYSGRTVMTASQEQARNVLGGPLELCCNSPKTGFYRDGFCHTGPQDFGKHTVCARVTQDFLDYSRSQGNDLITPMPEYGFPGLNEGDGWCLCASRWLEAANAGKACPIVLASTHEKTLEIVPLELLKQNAIDA